MSKELIYPGKVDYYFNSGDYKRVTIHYSSYDNAEQFHIIRQSIDTGTPLFIVIPHHIEAKDRECIDYIKKISKNKVTIRKE